MTEAGFEPLLSSDETEALLHAMRSNSANHQGAREIDLGSSDSFLRAAQEHAEAMTREFASEMRGVLRRLMGTAQTVKEGAVDVTPFNVFASSIVPGSAVAVLGADEGLSALLVVGAELASRVLRKKLGGAIPGPDAPTEPPRPFLSAVDRRILRPFLEDTLAAFARAWGPPGLGLNILELPARASEMPRVPQFESLLRVPVSVSLGGDLTDEVVLLITSKAARLPKKPETVKKSEPLNPLDRRKIAARLSHAEVELIAVLGRASSSIREILALEIGDVIRLNEAPHQPVHVTVEGHPKFIGSPVVQHGNLAIEVKSVLKGEP